MRTRSRFPGAILLLLFAGVSLALAGLLAPAFCTDDPAPDPVHKVTLTSKGVDPPTRMAQRHGTDARFAIASEDGDAELVITRQVVAVQLSDRGLARVRKQLGTARNTNDANPLGWFQDAIVAAVGSFVEHCAECPLSAVQDARYVDGRIVVLADDGKPVFGHIDVDGKDVMASFAEKDARRFVAAVRQAAGIVD